MKTRTSIANIGVREYSSNLGLVSPQFTLTPGNKVNAPMLSRELAPLVQNLEERGKGRVPSLSTGSLLTHTQLKPSSLRALVYEANVLTVLPFRENNVYYLH